jgi:hypothetical protein
MGRSLEDRLAIVQALIREFKPERIAYLTLSIIAVIALLGISLYGLKTEKLSVAEFIGLMGSGGALSLSVVGLLRMWRDALKFIVESKELEG